MKHLWIFILYCIALIAPASADMREAISSGDAEAVQQLLAAGASPHTVDAPPGQITVGPSPQGRYPTIGLCIYHSQPHLIPLFVDAGANPEGGVCFWVSCTPFMHSAASGGQIEALRHLIAAGADVDLISPFGFFPGNVPRSSPHTPLATALASRQLQAARFLLDNGANPAAQIFAATNTESMDLLIEYGAAIRGMRIPEIFRPRFNRQFLQLPLAYGAVVDDTSLLDILTLDDNALNPTGPQSQLDPEELEWLLDNGIKIGGTLEDLTTILHFAIEATMSLAVVEVMVEAGAELNAVNIDGVTPLMLARARNSNDIADYLAEQGGTESSLPSYEQAIVDDDIVALSSYLGQGLSVDYRRRGCGHPGFPEGPPGPGPGEPVPPTPRPEPPVIIALQNNAMECARLLVRRGANLNLQYCNTSPLQLMIEENNLSGVRFLLDHGASLSHHLDTPLHLAARNDRPDVAELLVNAESIAALNVFGETPLDVATGDTFDLLQQRKAPAGHGISFWDAIRSGNRELIEAYREKGLDLETREPASEGNAGNLTPLLQAVESRQAEIALFFIKRHANVFAESSLLEKVRERQLSDVEEYLKNLLRFDIVPVHYWNGYFQIHIDYAGFDDLTRYQLENSADLGSWETIEGSIHSFQDSTERIFPIQLPGKSPQFFRLRRLGE